MNSTLALLGSILAVLAAAVHGYIFVLESVLWTRPATMRTFGVRETRDAEILRPMAFNQGFYNLFLAVGVGVGIAMFATGLSLAAGLAVTLFALGSMVLAAVVLVASNPRMVRAAAVQGLAPLLGGILLVLALVV